MDFFREIGERKPASGFAHCRVGSYQLADTRAIEMIELDAIQDNAIVSFIDESCHYLAQHRITFAQGDPTDNVNNGNSVDVASAHP